MLTCAVQMEREVANDAQEQAALQEDEELTLTIHAGGELDQVWKTNLEPDVAVSSCRYRN